MTEIADYLMLHYYAHYKGTRDDIIPSRETLLKGLNNHKDKVVVIRNDKIKGVAVYVTISDDTFKTLKDVDITREDVIIQLLEEHGPNVHILMLAADGYNTIMMGIEEIKRRVNPRTISWWNPKLTKLHRFTIRR